MVNHDTRELKFKLPGDGAISGLSPVCECLLQKQKLIILRLIRNSIATHTSHSHWRLVPNIPSLHAHQHSR